MSRLFPKLATCAFNIYGPAGTVETKDALCVLPLNVLIKKIYIIIWFWLFALGILSFMALIYRLIIILVPNIRISLIAKRVLY